MERERYNPDKHPDRPMDKADLDVFRLELVKKEIEAALADSGDHPDPILAQARDLMEKWIPLLEKRERSDNELEKDEIQIEIDALVDDNVEVFAHAREIIDRFEEIKFNQELESAMSNTDKLQQILEDHMMRYGHTSRSLPAYHSAMLWRSFGMDERIKPYIREAFTQGYRELTALGLTPQEIIEANKWLDETKKR